MRKLLSILLVLALCLSLTAMAFASGEASASAGMGSTTLAGMLSMTSYVVVNQGDSTVSFSVYGIFKDGGEGEAAFVIDRDADLGALTVTVYADRAMTEPADGVTAELSNTAGEWDLILYGVETAENTAYCIGTDYPGETTAPTAVYVVNDQYAAPVDYALRDGRNIALSAYAPGVASESKSSIYIGANTTLLSAADYGITDKTEAVIADWWLGSGVTNAGITLEDFGDTFYRFELCVDLYRQFQIVIEENTTAASNGGEFIEPEDSNPTMGSNDQYSDSVSATVYAGVWDGIYTTMGADGYLENIDGVTTLGVAEPVDEETLFTALYNAFTSPWAMLSERGAALAANLNAKTGAEKVAQMKAALGMENWAIENYSTQKLAVLDVLRTADAYVAIKTNPGAGLQKAAESAGYAAVQSAPADIEAMLEQLAARVIDGDTEITGEDIATDYPTALFVKDGNVKITDSTIISSGDNTAAGPGGKSAQELLGVTAGMPATSAIGYNMTAANAYYREGFGAGLIAWGPETVVDITTTTGELAISAPSNGSMAGGLFNSNGASICVENAVAFSGGQHLSNTVYNGTIHYLDACAIGSGRMYSSDFWGGNVVLENTVASGGDVTDEPTALVCKNSVFRGSGSINGYATMYFENSLIEGGNFSTQNNTSLISDTATVTLVNSRMDGAYLLRQNRSSRAVVTLVDSQVNLSDSTLATLTNGSYTSGNLGEDFYDIFQTQGRIYTYGENEISFTGDSLTVSVDKDQSLTLYVKEIVGGEITNTGEGDFQIVYGDEYGVLTLIGK